MDDKPDELLPGDPVLICTNRDVPCSTGISPRGAYAVSQWGVVRDDSSIITPIFPSDVLAEVVEIGAVDLADLPEGFRLARQEVPPYDRNLCLERATGLVDMQVPGPISAFADDFIIWCLTGEPMKPDEHMGEHLVVHFETGIVKGDHHGIAISNDWVIHFDRPVGDLGGKPLTSRNKIVLSTRQEFFENYPERIEEYNNESDRTRISARNRAVNAWLFQCFGSYNLFMNNCEHFARWCKTGKSSFLGSSQIQEFLTMCIVGGIALAARQNPHAFMATQRVLHKFTLNPFSVMYKEISKLLKQGGATGGPT